MAGRFIPPANQLFNLTPWAANFLDNATLVQFMHRMTAYLLLALALLHALHARAPTLGKRAARRADLLAALVVVQAGLGITTLILVVPLWAAMAHQATAMAVLGVAVIHRRKMD
jgi:cytochrome c oxidase assembly protein subunit 15